MVTTLKLKQNLKIKHTDASVRQHTTHKQPTGYETVGFDRMYEKKKFTQLPKTSMATW